jgi:hypothetical protein
MIEVFMLPGKGVVEELIFHVDLFSICLRIMLFVGAKVLEEE